MRNLLGWLIILASIGFGQNWEISPILSEPGSMIDVALATDTVCLPHIALSEGTRLGYASLNGTVWDIEYPDTSYSSGFTQVQLCLDNKDVPHIAYVLAGWPEPSELRYAYRDRDTWRIDTVVGGGAPGSLTLGALALARDGSPHMVVVDSVTVKYAYKTDQWRGAGGWGTETVKNGDVEENMSIAVDRTGRPHIVFKPHGNDTLFYARRLFVGTEEPPPPGVQPRLRLLVRPNPAFGDFTVQYGVPVKGRVRLMICDVQGRVETVIRDGELNPGYYRDAFRKDSRPVLAGVHFLVLAQNGMRLTRKLVLME
ncbi:MAG: hypothetical protein NTX53_04330 [candidate division WOR-3 bacterium]|nr:hypothetical protein [candidate division WOR-3 bacterium]